MRRYPCKDVHNVYTHTYISINQSKKKKKKKKNKKKNCDMLPLGGVFLGFELIPLFPHSEQ